MNREDLSTTSAAETSRLAPFRQLFAWAMYDFANSSYATVVLSTIFSAYFVGVVADNGGHGGDATFYWTVAISTANLLVLLTAPILGALADSGGHKKRFLFVTTITCVVFTALLATVGRGEIFYGMVVVAIATLMFSSGENFIAAFLPEISPPEHMGRISGYGWGLGYIGGIIVLLLCFAYISWATSHGQTAEQYVPVTMLITAACFGSAATVTFLFLPERAARKPVQSMALYFKAGFARVSDTLHRARHYTDLWRALAAMAVYHCGIYTVVVVAAVYASEVMGFTTNDTIKVILIVNVTAAVGALLFGQLQDRFGSIRSLQVALLVWIVALALIGGVASDTSFWLAANLIGLAMGASQSGGRALVGRFSPVAHAAEFFGLWGLATKLSAIIGPLVYGAITLLTQGNHGAALIATTSFFLVGVLILQSVDENRGRAATVG